MRASVALIVVGSLAACRHGPPAGWVPIEQVVDTEGIARSERAAGWGMPAPLALAYLQTSDPDGCPTAQSDLPPVACLQAPAGRGHTAAAPLHWGAALSADPLPWFGRLRCPSGATPTVMREEDTAHLQVWTVTCGAETLPPWHVSPAQTCSSPCPPDGMVLLPADALLLERLAEEALGEARLGDALREAVALTERAGGFASSWSQLGAAQAANHNYRAAREAFDHAAQIDPLTVDYAWYAALAAWSASEWEDAAERATRLLGRLEATDDRRPDTMCMEASARDRLGMSGAAELLVAACAAGARGCCP